MIKTMANFRDTLDELFVTKLNFEFIGTQLPIPLISGSENILKISKEYSARGIDVILAECKDRSFEFQKQVIKAHKSDFPNAHFLFISNEGKVFDLYNVSTAKKLKPITYNEIERNTRLFKEKIELFNVEEAEGTVDLKIKIDKAFDVNDKVSKKFFDKFQKIHEKLQGGISDNLTKEDKSWYASVLLNRIMFIYFLQKHHVIQNDTNFLLNKFDEVSMRGEDYYKDFLLPLFFLGFARKDRDPLKEVFTKKFGPIRYLNGGLFYPHHIENKYTVVKEEIVDSIRVKPINDPLRSTISVDATVLQEILEFLNGYTWYLDNRPMKDEKDINPDVLGYIFEKYINQKELGAYYTKEDITEYISKNTIIPFIFDKLRTKGYDAPDPAPLITKNEDIKQAIADYVESITDYEQLKYLYNDILLPLSVLDPAVGSGAFLFSALNILLPIYRKVVFKLKSFRSQVTLSEKSRLKRDDESKGKHSQSSFDASRKKQRDLLRMTSPDPWLETLCKTLEAHSEEYFLTKQIILNNLYGVDIVEEATEICKLRLFLQLASHLPNIQHIEPLPDIDFNIYAGNSLVGGLSWDDLEANYSMKFFDKQGEKLDVDLIKSEIQKVSEKKRQYRIIQQSVDDEATLKTMKEEIQFFENRLNGELIDIGVSNPFHWFIEFNDIIGRGGFDVVIGNPPYLEKNQINYEIHGFKTSDTGAIHAMFVERAMNIVNTKGCVSMILPMSIVSTQRMDVVQELFENQRSCWYSNFSWRPAKMFDQVNRALTIVVSNPSKSPNTFTTNYQKWVADDREGLIDRIHYVKVARERNYFWVPKIGSTIEQKVLNKIIKNKIKLVNYFAKTNHRVYYRTTGGLYWKIFTNFSPKFNLNGVAGHSSRETWFSLQKKEMVYTLLAILSSNTFWWWYTISSNCRDMNPYDVQNFPIPESLIADKKLEKLGEEYIKDVKSNSFMLARLQKKTGKTETQCFRLRLSKPIIDEIDKVLAKHYGFTKEELEFIINYDLRFRMGAEEEEE
ncbi:MAG: Eco57I restriction-modification methylase domain-containing protein [Bacteroidota bacterium]|nr:Eco57I restriction-modification methylase domain-containing protein [Bacteroidota bacterium]